MAFHHDAEAVEHCGAGDRFRRVEVVLFHRAGAGEIKFNDLVLPTSHPIAGEISSIVSQLQTDLKQEVSRVVNGKTYVVTMTHSWICLACEFENEFERSKCELCYKNRPPKDWNDFKI